MDNQSTIPTDHSKGNPQLPLYDFFILLKQYGFSVTPQQIVDANLVINHYANLVKNEQELCQYLSPLFAKDEEEQKLFTNLFNKSFGKANDQANNAPGFLKRHRLTILGMLLFAVLAILFIIYYVKPVMQVNNCTIEVNRKYNGTIIAAPPSFTIGTNEQLELIATAKCPFPDSSKKIELKAIYDWGDQANSDSSGAHFYSATGVYNFIARASLYVDGQYTQTDTFPKTITVCNDSSTLIVGKNYKDDTVRINSSVTYRAHVEGNPPDSIQWLLSNSDGDTLAYGETFSIVPTEEGSATVTCTAVYGNIQSPCNIDTSFSIIVADPGRPKLKARIEKAPDFKPLAPEYKVKGSWFWLFIGIMLIGLFTLFIIRKNRRKHKQKGLAQASSIEEKYRQLQSSFSGRQPPFEIPFQSKNGFLLPEPIIGEAARQMRKRLDDDTNYLHIPKTINRAINNSGLFMPVMASRTQQSEYLVLIDESVRNNQFVKLIGTLFDIFRKQNVIIEKYYYKEGPMHCFSAADDAEVSLEKLSQKYNNSVLLIVGNGYELLEPSYPVFQDYYRQLLKRWKYKAIITPKSFADWGTKELNALLPEIPIFPADVEGLQLLIQTIFGDTQSIASFLFQKENQFYSTANIDFEDIDALKKYCNEVEWAITKEDGTNVMFQWIAALAVYPKIKWEITLSVGKSILDKYGKGSELNYTNLLRIARIKWMLDGVFPDYIRLDLLKELSRPNEILARDTIIELLNEIGENDLPVTSLAYEEKEIQLISNQFVLFASDPVKYAAYQHSEALFAKLWKEKKIKDSPARVYIENKNAAWSTPVVSHETGRDNLKSQPESIALNDYFGSDSSIPKSTVESNRLIQLFALLMSLLGIIGLALLTILHFANTNKFAALTYKKVRNENIVFTLKNNDSLNKYLKNTYLNVGEATVRLEPNQLPGSSLLLPINDSTKRISVSQNGNTILDTSFQINESHFTVDIDKDSNIIVVEKTTVKLLLANTCSQSGPKYKKLLYLMDSTIQVKDSLISNNGNSSSNCFLKIAGGENTSIIMNRIMSLFNNNNILVTMDNTNQYSTLNRNEVVLFSYFPQKTEVYLDYNNIQLKSQVLQLKDCLNMFEAGATFNPTSKRKNEIFYDPILKDSLVYIQQCLKKQFPNRVFSTTEVGMKNSPVKAQVFINDTVPKPLISIQVSDKNMLPGAEQFRQRIMKAGYKANAVTISSYQYNSEIYYFNNALKAAAEDIRRMYSSFYPALPVKANLRNNNQNVGTNNIIVVWMQAKVDADSLPLQLNSKGNKVRQLQSWLYKLGYTDVPQNGTFDKQTETAVLLFQQSNKMTQDGIVGKQVWSEIQSKAAIPIVLPPDFGKRVVEIAKKEIGSGAKATNVRTRMIKMVDTKYEAWFGESGGSLDAIFVSWVYAQAGNTLSGGKNKKGFSSFKMALDYFIKTSKITNHPLPGDIVIIHSPSGSNTTGGIFVRWTDEANGEYEIIEADVPTLDNSNSNANQSNQPANMDIGKVTLQKRLLKGDDKTYFVDLDGVENSKYRELQYFGPTKLKGKAAN